MVSPHQGSFAFGAANGLLRKMVPALERFDTTILDLTDTDDMDDTAALVPHPYCSYWNATSMAGVTSWHLFTATCSAAKPYWCHMKCIVLAASRFQSSRSKS